MLNFYSLDRAIHGNCVCLTDTNQHLKIKTKAPFLPIFITECLMNNLW